MAGTNALLTATKQADAGPPRPADPRLILVVDDEAQIVDVIATLLEDEGFQVSRAYDGEEAWQRAIDERPDLVISDVSMPRLDGPALVRRLRATHLHATPVILMSAVNRWPPREGASFVAKPFDLDHMLSAIDRELAPPHVPETAVLR